MYQKNQSGSGNKDYNKLKWKIVKFINDGQA